jgi:hypothetical protein
MVPVPFPACLSLSLWLIRFRSRGLVSFSLSFSSHLFFFLSHNDDCLFSAFRLFILAAGYAQDLFIYVAFEENDDGPSTSAHNPSNVKSTRTLSTVKSCLFVQPKHIVVLHTWGYMVDVTPNNKPLVLFCTALTTWRPSGWLGLRTDLTGYIFLFRMTPIWVYTCGLYIVSASHYMCCSRKDQIPQSVIHFPRSCGIYFRVPIHIFTIVHSLPRLGNW